MTITTPKAKQRSSTAEEFILSLGAPLNAAAVAAADRERHLAERRCVVRGCDGPLSCPEHGDVAEERGSSWWWGS